MLDNIFRITNDFNDLDKLKIYNLISQKGGGNFNMFNLIFGIIVLVIGAVFISLPYFYKSTTATITDITNDNFYTYITFTYNVNNSNHTKQITVNNKDDYSLNSKVPIYYDNNDPNTMTLSLTNYYIIGGIFLIFGIYILFIKDYSFSKKINLEGSSIYDTDSNLDNIKII
jgi:hypothetical protein